MKLIDLIADNRTLTGNGPARELRRGGKIPAVLYGPGAEPKRLAVTVKDLETVMKDSQTGQLFVNLSVGKGKPKPALLKELQRHPVTGKFLHADFYQVDMDRKVKVMVPVVTRGKSIGVEMGGMLQVIRRNVEVFCLPDRIPEHIEIDITDLEMGESVHVEDIDPGEAVDIPHDVNFTILTVVSGRMKAVEAEEGEEEVEGEEVAEGAEAEAGEGTEAEAE